MFFDSIKSFFRKKPAKPRANGGYRHVVRIALPMVLGNAAFTIMQFTDRVLLAHYSSEAIQAALPAGILTFSLLSFFASLAGYAGTFVSQYYGANDLKGCAKACVGGVAMSFLFLPAFALMIPLCPWLMSLAGHSENLLAAEKEYSFWMIMTGVPLSLHWVLNGYLVGRNKVIAATVVSTAGCFINIGLDILFIFGYWGCPRMGIGGAAFATFLSQIAGIFLFAAAIVADGETRALPWRELWRPDWRLMKRIAKFGLPSGFAMLSDSSSFAVFSLLLGRFDALSLATSNVVLSINSMAISPLMGFGNAASVLVGQFQGAHKGNLAMKAGWRCLHLGWLYMVFIGLVFLFFSEQLLGLFRSPDSAYTVAEMVKLGKLLLFFCVCWGMFDTMNVVLIGGLRGAGDTRFVFFALLLVSWVFWVPSELLAVCVFGGTVVTAWLFMLAAIVIFSAVFFWRWKDGKWKKIDVIGDGRLP